MTLQMLALYRHVNASSNNIHRRNSSNASVLSFRRVEFMMLCFVSLRLCLWVLKASHRKEPVALPCVLADNEGWMDYAVYLHPPLCHLSACCRHVSRPEAILVWMQRLSQCLPTVGVSVCPPPLQSVNSSNRLGFTSNKTLPRPRRYRWYGCINIWGLLDINKWQNIVWHRADG